MAHAAAAFHGRRPIMIGDDHGDESALLAAQCLGGIGLKVAGVHFSSACAEFSSASSVRSWLTALASQPRASRGAPAGVQLGR